MIKPIAWMYVTEVCNRFEETEYPPSTAERMYREKILEIIPLYKKSNDND